MLCVGVALWGALWLLKCEATSDWGLIVRSQQRDIQLPPAM